MDPCNVTKCKIEKKKEKKREKETMRMFAQEGIEPDTPACETNTITTTPRPLLIRIVK